METQRKAVAMLVTLLFVSIPLVRSAHASSQHEEAVTKLSSLEGRTVYAVGFSRLYESSSTFEDMQQNLTLKRYLTGWEALDDFCRDRVCRSRRIPLLSPLRIVKIDYVPGHEAVIFRLQTQNGIDVLSLTTAETLSQASHESDLLRRVCGLLLPDIPKDLSASEIVAVQKRRLSPGISEKAIIDMLGFPITDTEWGKGRQLLYSESLVIYLNAERRLVQLNSQGVAQLGDLSNQINSRRVL